MVLSCIFDTKAPFLGVRISRTQVQLIGQKLAASPGHVAVRVREQVGGYHDLGHYQSLTQYPRLRWNS